MHKCCAATAVIFFLLGGTGSADLRQPDLLSITVSAGTGYVHTHLGITYRPQIALWIEDTAGRYMATVFVTSYGQEDFLYSKAMTEPAALPVWYHTVTASASAGAARGDLKPSRSRIIMRASESLDGVTGATPRQSFTRRWSVPDSLKNTTLVVRAEVNLPFDFNQVWQEYLPKKDPRYNGQNGQPSVVYEGRLTPGAKSEKVLLAPAGHGHPRGSDKMIVADLSGLTTALTIVETIGVTFVP